MKLKYILRITIVSSTPKLIVLMAIQRFIEDVPNVFESDTRSGFKSLEIIDEAPVVYFLSSLIVI